MNVVYEFGFHDGDSVKTLRDMALKLDAISNELFLSHNNEQKNDFSQWFYAMGEEDFAKTIEKIKDKKEFTYQVMKFALLRMED